MRTVTVHVVKCGLSGPPETGKTHVRALMLGKPRPSQQRSTEIATKADQITPDFKRIDEGVWNIEDSHMWLEVNKDRMTRLLADTLSSISSSDSQPEDLNLLPIYSLSPTEQHKVSYNIVSDIKEHLKHRNRGKGKGLNGIRLVYFVDVGGQPQFQIILPYFIRCDISLLVHNLSQDLDSCPGFSYTINGQNFSVPEQVQASNIDIIDGTVRSICSNMTQKPEYKPHIAIIGTHKDVCDTLCHDYNKMLKEKHAKIEKRLENYIGTHHVDKCELIRASREQCIFTIDGSAEGWNSNQHTLEDLKQRIHNYAEQRSVEVPIKFFVFIESLISYTDNHSLQYLTLDQCRSIASDNLFMTEPDMYEALKLFDDYNLLLYFPEILPEYVFIKPGFLYGLTTELIVASFLCENDVLNEERKLFQKSGIFTNSILSSLKLEDNNFSKKDFLELLKGLFIIAELHPKEFFMPCVLSVAETTSEILTDIKECMKSEHVDGPLCISFVHRKSPRGLFCALLVALAGKDRWKLRNYVKDIFRHRNLFEFLLHDQYNRYAGEVTIIDKNSHFEVYTTCGPDTCLYIQQTVAEALKKACSSMKYNENDVDLLGFPCRIFRTCDGSHCTFVFPEEGKERCSKNRSRHILLTAERLVWFKHSTSESKYTGLSTT